MRRNPLIFDNRFDPEAVRRSRSRVIASLTAPPAQRAQVTRLADSPHTFRVILFDSATYLSGDYYGNEGLATLSQPGCITLVLRLSEMEDLDFRARNKSLPKTAGLSRFSAFTLLHRMGDALFVAIGPVAYGNDPYALDLLTNKWQGAFDRLYVPGEVSPKTWSLARQVYNGARIDGVAKYIRTHTNSQMSRDEVFGSDIRDDANQCVADWVALSEMPSARARLGRGEPWLLFPPKPGEYAYPDERAFTRYAETINTYFPPFIQSLLDDLDGAVIRL